MRKFEPNVIGFQLAPEARRWYIVGCYLSRDDTSTIERVVEALRSRPKGEELLVAGDINAKLAAPDGDITEETVVHSQDVVCPGPDLPSVPKYPPCPPNPTPPPLLPKEVL